LGAGQMAEIMIRHLATQKAPKILISNRTRERAEALARNFKAAVLPWENRGEALQEVDIVLSSTGSPEPVVTKEMVEKSLKNRRGRSLFMVDIAMPRDIEEEIHSLEHVYLYRLEDLEHIVAKNLEGRAAEISKAKEIIEFKTAEISEWLKALKEGREVSFKHSSRPKMPRTESARK
jgi:glutamyl-tRNA reductase